MVTAGQRGDAPVAAMLLEGLGARGLRARHVLADAAYDSDAIRGLILESKAIACIKPRATRRRKDRFDRGRYRNRNVIERFFGRIKRCRRVATRYEKKAENFAAFVWIAAGITTPMNVRMT